MPVTREARELAENMGVRIFSADIIYHLFDQFTAYLKQARCSDCVLIQGLISSRDLFTPHVHTRRNLSIYMRVSAGVWVFRVQRACSEPQVKEDEQAAARLEAVFPCILKILPTCIFNKKDPIVLGVDVVEGIAKVGIWIRTQQRLVRSQPHATQPTSLV